MNHESLISMSEMVLLLDSSVSTFQHEYRPLIRQENTVKQGRHVLFKPGAVGDIVRGAIDRERRLKAPPRLPTPRRRVRRRRACPYCGRVTYT